MSIQQKAGVWIGAAMTLGLFGARLLAATDWHVTVGGAYETTFQGTILIFR